MYPIKKRQCIFAREDKVFYAGYTYSDCIVQCKVEAIYNICGCRPFIYPRRGIQYSLKVCNIEDTICLVKNRGKWQSFAPNTAAKLQDFFEKSDNQSSALNCQDCYPSCEDVLFIIHTSSSYISPGFFKSELLYDMNITNQSILHIFFSKYGTLRLKQDVALRWYEVLSSIGGICGVFIGFSLISAVEMIYFSVLLLIKLFQQYKRSRVFIKDEPRRIDQPIRTLYWNELLPPVRTYNVHRHHNATAARI
ncbi:sodium channel protein Nach-like [Prorops nasuta]|uniref:sodium channel protein Nach-like n=1 Tax=Prorops nasuta TaxID=863751 RepID=UPI0034CFE037